jgi:Glyoxalase-like domain
MATTTEDAEAKLLMESWEKANPATDDSISSDDGDDEPLSYDDMLDQYRREVHIGNNELDHIVLGVSDLDKALDVFETMTGTRPVMVVSLNGVGTKSARVAFQEAIFLEIIAPDPKQDCGHMGDKLKSIPEGEFVPLHYAVRSTELEARKKVWREMGLDCDMVTMVAKDRGAPWKWDMWIVENHGT